MATHRVPTVCAVALAIPLMIAPFSPASAQDVTVRIIEEPYRDVYAFLGVYFEALGAQPAEQGGQTIEDAPQLGFGLRLMSARESNLQLELGVEYREMDLKELNGPDKATAFNMLIGGRMHPLTPTFALGNLAFRLTLAAHGGFSAGDAFGAALDVSGGFSISSGNDPNGLVIEVVGRPVEYTIEDIDEVWPDVLLRRSWVLRAGFQFGP